MLTLAISSLSPSNLPWFMDLTSQVPLQYCSLQHQSLFPSPVTSTTGRCFRFFLELFLHSSPVAYWAPTDLGVRLSVSYLFAFLYCLWVFKAKWFAIPFSSGPLEFCQNYPPWSRPSCVALQGMAHSFIELDKAVIHVISLVSFLWLWFSFCLPSNGW